MLGKDLDDGDRFLTLETCGGSFLLPRFSSAGVSMREVLEQPMYAYSGDAKVRMYGRRSGAKVGWGDVQTSAQGGEYRLCWCGGRGQRYGDNSPWHAMNELNVSDGLFACSLTEHFVVDLGEPTLIGPSPLNQHQTCVSGQMCKLDGILGQHLVAADQATMLDTCSDDGSFSKIGILSRFGGYGVVLEISSSGAIMSWGDFGIQHCSRRGVPPLLVFRLVCSLQQSRKFPGRHG